MQMVSSMISSLLAVTEDGPTAPAAFL